MGASWGASSLTTSLRRATRQPAWTSQPTLLTCSDFAVYLLTSRCCLAKHSSREKKIKGRNIKVSDRQGGGVSLKAPGKGHGKGFC